MTLVDSKANAVPIIVYCAYTRPPRIRCGMGTDERSPEGRGAVTRRKIRLDSLCLQGKCPGTRHMEGIYRGRHRPDATYLDTRRPEEIYGDTLRLEGKCPDTCHLEGICCGRHRPDATYLDTRRLEEICLDTLRLEGKMPLHASSGRNTR